VGDESPLQTTWRYCLRTAKKTPDRKMRVWLERYRAKLEEKLPNSDLIVADVGPLSLGSRLSSSKAPDGFEMVIYPKGSWIIHMIREMLRQPGTKNPDARFRAFLQKIYTKYSFRALSTTDLQHELDAVMTPAMDMMAITRWSGSSRIGCEERACRIIERSTPLGARKKVF